MKCPFCGAQIADDSLFCTECGKELPKSNACPSDKRKLSWIIGAILLFVVIIGIGIYCFSRIGSDSDSKDAKVFIEGMYKDLFEPWNPNRFDETILSKYFTAEAMNKFCLESDDEEGVFSYYIDFLVDGSLGGADYGEKVVSRSIEPESDGWFLVTNIWDVIQKPVRVHLQVKSVDRTIKIVDIKLEDDDEFEIDDM